MPQKQRDFGGEAVNFKLMRMLWDAATGSALQTMAGHTGGAQAVAFSPDGKQLASASWDWRVRLWNAATGVALQTLAGHIGGVGAVAFSPDGKQLASTSRDGTVRSGHYHSPWTAHTWK